MSAKNYSTYLNSVSKIDLFTILLLYLYLGTIYKKFNFSSFKRLLGSLYQNIGSIFKVYF